MVEAINNIFYFISVQITWSETQTNGDYIIQLDDSISFLVIELALFILLVDSEG